MGKVLESLGVIDGYDTIAIGKGRAKKDELFEELKKFDENIQEEVKELVNNTEGRIFAIKKKGLLYGIFLFEVEEKDDKKHLKHIKTVYSDEVTEEVREKVNGYMLKTAEEYVSYMQYDKVTFDDKVVQLDPKKSKKEKIWALIGGMGIGFVLGWILFDDFWFGLMWAFVLGPTFTGLDVVISNKRGRKKKED